MKKGLYIALVVLLVATFGLSAFYLGSYFLEGKKEADRYQELSNIVEEAKQEESTEPASEEPTESTKPAPTEPQNTEILKCYQELYDQNNDLVGWLRIDGTKIDYPVLQTKTDNANYYLYRNFDKEDSSRGSIYVREECDVFEPSDNVTMYGHNMRDGSMFAALGAYENKDTWEQNSLICFDTLYDYHVYKIFAVFKTTASIGEGFGYQKFEDASIEQEFNKFIATCKQLSFYDTGITPTYGDKIICLSTCEYTLENGRFVVAAVRIS